MSKFIPPEAEEPSQSVSINLTESELEMLAWLAEKTDMTPKEIIEDFVADLTGSWRNGGSDERQFAFAWFNRRGYAEEHIFAHEATKWRRDETG